MIEIKIIIVTNVKKYIHADIYLLTTLVRSKSQKCALKNNKSIGPKNIIIRMNCFRR